MRASNSPASVAAAAPNPSGEPKPRSCPACGATGSVRTFLSLGALPLGNAFVPPEEVPEEREFPLDMGFCERCCLVQVIDPAPASALDRVYRHYSYVPTGTTLARHYRDLAEEVIDVVRPASGSLFVDVGSNDGLLLRELRGHAPGIRIVGVEPSDKISEIARNHGVPTVHGFFDDAAVRSVRSEFGSATVVSATQVFQHLREPAEFLRKAESLLEPEGTLVLEGRAYMPDVIAKVSFDTFYHELLFCFTLHSLHEILGRAGFVVFHAERSDVYGGSLRVYARKASGSRPVDGTVAELLRFEKECGVPAFETYRAFGARVAGVRDELARTVRDLRSAGNRIVGYGAPSTGNTLLNYCRLGREFLDCIVDDNPLKQGLVAPGTHLPITDSRVLEDRTPEYVLLVAWRLREEILAKLHPLRSRGLRGVIVPLPSPEVVGA
jgi:SAM-dependent methyltransferase